MRNNFIHFCFGVTVLSIFFGGLSLTALAAVPQPPSNFTA
jgi:hypothetical protein